MDNFFVFAWKILPDLLKGAKVTVVLSVMCISIGIIFGYSLGIARVYANRIIYWLVTGYIEFMRGVPTLVKLFFIYYGLGDIGILMKPIVAATLALGLSTSAYQAEYFRGAILSIKPGQMTAARALGLSKWRAIRYVVFPQAIRLALPSSSNEIIYEVKYTSIAFTVGVVELMCHADMLGAYYFRYFEAYIVATAIYVVIVLLIAKFLNIIEKKFAIPGLQMK